MTERELTEAIINHVTEIVNGTPFAPPEGGVIVDLLMVMIIVDKNGEHGISWINHGSNQAAEGMAIHVQRSIETGHISRLQTGIDDMTDDEG